ncbi:MAG: site-specific integrase [Chitinophagaceae bacterium]|nr:site-specific integrase [Chitinophagaceae bacterium]
MKEFEAYLFEKRYRPLTVSGHIKNVSYFLQWIESNNMSDVENISYTDLLSYIQYEQKRNLDTATINLRLSSISHYFEFLKQENTVSRNPARTLRLKGKLRTITEKPLQYEELEQLYYSYKTLEKTIPRNCQKIMPLVHQRNTVIVGLLVWQGLHSGEIEKLNVQHINLDAGTIHVPGTVRSNERKLALNAQQILTLHTYLYGGVRDKLRGNGDGLFPGRAYDTVQHLVKELQGINPVIRNVQHIRASVILYWLKQYNKRQVQYMLGYRYIDSVERYAAQQTETLTDLLSKHHPFG